MYDKLTESDIRKMEEEIEHRRLVVRPRLLEDVKEARPTGISARTLSITRPKRPKTRTKAESDIWSA